MTNNQTEKNEVLLPCLLSCKFLVKDGAILEAKRLDALDYDHKKGAPDIEIRFVKDGILWLILCECKRPDGGGIQLQSQINYENKYMGIKNVIYVIVWSAKEMEKVVEHHTQFYTTKLKNIEFNPGPEELPVW